MGSDKNEEQRYEYNVQIAEKERMLDDLQSEQKKAQLMIEHFAERMMASYQRLEAIEAEMKYGQNSFNKTAEEKRYVAQLCHGWQAEVEQTYLQATQAVEDEREALQQERDALPWD